MVLVYNTLSLFAKICVYSRKIALYLARVWRLFAKFMGLFAKETFACFVNKTKNKKP